MIVTNALTPTGEQISALAADQRDEPIVMLNLLKFRAKAVYPDGRDPELSGEAAYMRYAEQMIPYVESRGARVVFQGDARLLAVGEVEDVGTPSHSWSIRRRASSSRSSWRRRCTRSRSTAKRGSKVSCCS